jgi:dCMP deaminase
MKEKFIDYFSKIAINTSQLSHARRLKVGAIIVKNDCIVSFGYNGTPSGWDNNCEYEIPEQIDVETRTTTPARLVTKPEVLHAEMNALMKLAKSTMSSEDGTMFCTHAPCLDCAKGIYQAGISSVYYINEYKRSNEGINFLKKSGVEICQVK